MWYRQNISVYIRYIQIIFSIPDIYNLSTYYRYDFSICRMDKMFLSTQHVDNLSICGIENFSLPDIEEHKLFYIEYVQFFCISYRKCFSLYYV